MSLSCGCFRSISRSLTSPAAPTLIVLNDIIGERAHTHIHTHKHAWINFCRGENKKAAHISIHKWLYKKKEESGPLRAHKTQVCQTFCGFVNIRAFPE